MVERGHGDHRVDGPALEIGPAKLGPQVAHQGTEDGRSGFGKGQDREASDDLGCGGTLGLVEYPQPGRMKAVFFV